MTDTPRHRTAFSATLAGLQDQLGAGPPVVLADDVRADGERVLVTGASRGLGLAITTQLAERGAEVFMACRSRQHEAPTDVRSTVPDATLHVLPVDLAVPATVDRLVRGLTDDDVVLDRVVLNAGVVAAADRTTEAGLDVMVHVNFVANAQLVDALRSAGRLRPGARIVVVGSEAHRSAGELDLDTWRVPRTYGSGGSLKEYGRSKLLLHTWAHALAQRAPEVQVVHLCPGAIASDIAREAPSSLQWIVGPVMRWLFPSPARAARSVVWATLTPELHGRTGAYLHLGHEKDPSQAVRDTDAGDRLWTEVHHLLPTLREVS